MSIRKFLGHIFKRGLHDRPDFSKNSYNVTRGNYNHLDNKHISFFESVLGSNRVVTDLSDLEKYNVDWYFQVRGASQIVLKPKTTEELSEIISFCNRNRLAVCPQGGNTGVCGGCIPVFDEIIISAELLNAIIDVDETSGTVSCQAGCTLESIDNFVAEKNLIVPLDIASKGTCQIGGNVSTNAGGMRLYKYGNMHSNVLGLEVVKPDGEVLNLMSGLRKDNTGYHLKNLFIGAEGTLGFVSKVALFCHSRPKFNHVAFLGLQNFNKVLKTFRWAKQELGEILSAIEILDSHSMDFAKEFNKVTPPIDEYPFYLIIETAGSNEEHDADKLEKFFAMALDKHLILNGIVAREPSKIQAIWNIRDLTPGYKTCGPTLLYDISLPLDNYYILVDAVRQHLGNISPRVMGYGHLGDSNLHLTIQLNNRDPKIKESTEQFLLKQVVRMNGSMSAEHGLGFLKSKYLSVSKPQPVVGLMRSFKKVFDPNGIMKPYKVFPSYDY